MNDDFSKLLFHSTTRIISNTGSVGTGFYIAFTHEFDGKQIEIPVLATNKHVVSQAEVIRILVSVLDLEGKNPNVIPVDIPLIKGVLFEHPDENVDLCGVILAPLFDDLYERGYRAEIFPFLEEQIYTNGKQKGHDLPSMQEIFMTGYPNGLWDEKNNKPLTRRGVTASDLNLNWNGNQEFVGDIACFPGSSGSPVYVFNDGPFMTKGSLVSGRRLILLGILYAGPTVTATGEIRPNKIPTDYKYLSETPLMMNLGFIIKAKQLFKVKEEIINMINVAEVKA